MVHGPLTVSSARPRRYVLLDGLRGVAALLVVLFHAARDGSPFYRLDPLFLMVDFFFVLSGFVLLPSLPRSWQGFPRAAVRFVVKRVVRLWPMLLSVLVVATALYYIRMWDTHRTGAGFDYDVNRNMRTYLAAALLLQIWVSKSMLMVVPLWSLSAEWFANLVFTPLTPVRRSVGVLAGITVGYVLMHWGLTHDGTWIDWIGPIRGSEALGRALTGFGIGLLTRQGADWVAHSRWRRGLTHPLWFGGALWLAWRLLDTYRDVGYAVIYLAAPVFAVVVYAASAVAIDPTSRLGRLLLRAGAWSFGVYAYHRVVMDAFNYLTAEPLHWWSTPVYMAPNSVWFHFIVFKVLVVTTASVALTMVTARLVERPAQHLGRRILARLTAA